MIATVTTGVSLVYQDSADSLVDGSSYRRRKRLDFNFPPRDLSDRQANAQTGRHDQIHQK